MASLFGCVSCQKAKNKRQQLRQSVDQYYFDTKDRLFPQFDATRPDTESNKRRFKEFVGIAPAADVKHLYCNADEMGIDASYSFVFTCDTATHHAIIRHLQLTPDSSIVDFALGGFATDVWWWNKAVMAREKPHSRQQQDLRWYLWRDQKNGKDYFLTFDM
ncbi:hypothetical protein I2I05_09675 [Hymenobacter sp. BT683]|uniref:Uncharacterized protein n=1 Tax=Hymenobacter jeongseonensis TaxID=2791027 RepID=A0ABS0IH27_9BACT|nr:hypothetical protein [Hymenobacter jeongseonensis]MBF9237663.1 hypothetical protein [Hymenobacter jeongseonensis]